MRITGGLSTHNLWRIKNFYTTYSEFVPPFVAEIGRQITANSEFVPLLVEEIRWAYTNSEILAPTAREFDWSRRPYQACRSDYSSIVTSLKIV